MRSSHRRPLSFPLSANDLKNVPRRTFIRRLLTISRCCDDYGEFQGSGAPSCVFETGPRAGRRAKLAWQKGRRTPPTKDAAAPLNSVGERAARPQGQRNERPVSEAWRRSSARGRACRSNCSSGGPCPRKPNREDRRRRKAPAPFAERRRSRHSTIGKSPPR